jgi:CubicO group peptidase (beta-lactamase class C family)
MMKMVFAFLSLFGGIFSFSFSQNAEGMIDNLMNAYSRNGVFSGAVLVADKGRVVYEKAFGLADRELNVPLTVGSKFKIASLSKTFTAVAVPQLVEEGKIKLDGTIKDYVPGLC